MGAVGAEQVVRMSSDRSGLINILLAPQLNVSLGFFSDTLPVLIKYIVSVHVDLPFYILTMAAMLLLLLK